MQEVFSLRGSDRMRSSVRPLNGAENSQDKNYEGIITADYRKV